MSITMTLVHTFRAYIRLLWFVSYSCVVKNIRPDMKSVSSFSLPRYSRPLWFDIKHCMAANFTDVASTIRPLSTVKVSKSLYEEPLQLYCHIIVVIQDWSYLSSLSARCDARQNNVNLASMLREVDWRFQGSVLHATSRPLDDDYIRTCWCTDRIWCGPCEPARCPMVRSQRRRRRAAGSARRTTAAGTYTPLPRRRRTRDKYPAHVHTLLWCLRTWRVYNCIHYCNLLCCIYQAQLLWVWLKMLAHFLKEDNDFMQINMK